MIKRTRILAFLVITLLLIAVITPSVYAFAISGYTWPSVDPINYWYNYYDYEDDPTGMSCWYYSAQDWNGTQTDVDFQIDDDPLQVQCSFAYQTGVTWDGLSFTYTVGDEITYVYVVYNQYFTNSYSTNAIKSVTCHELGHALGLADVGTGIAVLMNEDTYYRYYTYGIYTPQQDEVNGINYLY